MCDPITLGIASLATAVVGTGASIIGASKARKQQQQAMMQAERQAAETKAQNERAINRANQKSPDLAAIFGFNKVGQGGGVGSTMLTGPSGVPAGTMSLGRNTLLGR